MINFNLETVKSGNNNTKTKFLNKKAFVDEGLKFIANDKRQLGLIMLATIMAGVHIYKNSSKDKSCNNTSIPNLRENPDFKTLEQQKLCNISEVSQINDILLRFKNISNEYIKLIEPKMHEFYEECEDKEFAIWIMNILTRKVSVTHDLQKLYMFLISKNEEKEIFAKVYKYLKEHQLEYNDFFIMDNFFKPWENRICYNKGTSNRIYFDAEGNFTKRIIAYNGENIQSEIVETPNGKEIFRLDNYRGEITRMEFDLNENLLSKVMYRISKANPNCYEVTPSSANTENRIIRRLEQESGDIYTVAHKNNSTTTFKYFTEEDGSQRTEIISMSHSGKINYRNSYTRNVINPNNIQTIENGDKYDILFKQNQVIVTKNNSEQVIVEIGENSETSSGVLSRELLPVIKEMPGSSFFAIDKFGLAKIGKNINDVEFDNAHYRHCDKIIAMSEEQSSNIFTLLHEFGHYICYHLKEEQIQELKKTYQRELENWEKRGSNMELAQSRYLIKDKNSIQELFADFYSSRYTSGSEFDYRVCGIKRNFPETYRLMNKILQKEGL